MEANPAKPEFCAKCGASLESAEPLLQDEIRHLTMLFCDVTGFTAVSSRMSPDQLKEILDDCFFRFARAIQEQGGKVLKYEGDCIIAVFGVDKSSGVDPVHACFAALDMKKELSKFNDTLEKERGFRLGFRTGLHCGQVVVGMIGGRLDILGDAVNVAARMEENAPEGEILISRDLAAQLRDRFLLSPMTQIKVKGKEKPIKVHLLKGEAPFHQRQILENRTPFVGREKELSFMAGFFQETLASGNPSILLYQSPPGCGKSRLLAEFEASMAGKGLCKVFLNCVFSPNLTMNIQILRSFLQINRGIASREDLVSHLRRFFSHEEPETLTLAALHIASLLGLPLKEEESIHAIKNNPEETWNKAISLLAGIFSRLVRQSPVLVLLDDIQWIDEGSMRVLTSLMKMMTGPFCVIAMGRPEKATLENIAGFSNAVIRDLTPLSPEKSMELVKGLLSTLQDVPQSLMEQVTTIAQGNPFFIEEVIINLKDKDIIRIDENKWSIDSQRLGQIEIPTQIEMIVQARLDLLPRPDLELLKKASVMGRTFFWEPVARREGGKLPAEGIANFLNRGIILPGSDDVELGFRQYKFSHEIIREVLYSRLTRRQKHNNHLLMTEWFHALDLGEEVVLPYLCFHYERAEHFQEAVKCALRGGSLALRRYEILEACRFFEQVDRLLRKDSANLDQASLPDFLEQYSETLLLDGKPRAIIELLDSYWSRIDERSPNALRIRLKKLEALEKLGEETPWKAFLEESAALFRKLPARNSKEWKRLQAGFSVRQGEFFRLHGQLTEANDQISKALEIAEELRDKWDIAACHRSLGVICFNLGADSKALEHHRLALIALEELNNWEAVQTYLDNASRAYCVKLDLDQSRVVFETALAKTRAGKDKAGTAACLNYLGVISRYRQDYEKAIGYSQEACTLREEIGDTYGQMLCLGNMALANRSLGRYDLSNDLLEKGLEICRNKDPQGTSFFLISLATLWTIQNRFDKAIGYLRQAYDLRRKIGDDGMLFSIEKEIYNCIQKRDALKDANKKSPTAPGND
ncbi:MAG: adenylate/guanylate cyclase domain-containing protein [Candidatus Ozemobacteraceae bacterium]